MAPTSSTSRSSTVSGTHTRSSSLLKAVIGGAAISISSAVGYLAWKLWTKRQRRKKVSVQSSTSSATLLDPSGQPITMQFIDEHSQLLPSYYSTSFNYSNYDILVLFPSTIESEREKHYAVMSAENLPGANNLLLQPQDAQKKACTYGLDDSETELMNSLNLLRPRSIQFRHVSLESYPTLFADWTPQRKSETLILNLCDGTELDGIPGLSVLRYLQAQQMAFTGADEDFFVVSTYKIRMKRLFDQRKVSTAPWTLLSKEIIAEWKQFREQEPTVCEESKVSESSTTSSSTSSSSPSSTLDRPPHALTSRPSPFTAQFSPSLKSAITTLTSLPFPLLVKPDDSYCSCGITTRSVVFSPESALDYASEIVSQFSNIFVEQFIKGREFTVFIAGDARQMNLNQDLSTLTLQELDSHGTRNLRVLTPVERAFDTSLPFYEQFISYELFWEISRSTPGKDEFVFKPVPQEEMFQARRENGTTDSISLSLALQEEALRAYISVGGCGYSRVDLRFDPISQTIAVLEVNANCGITQYRQTAMGEILRESEIGFYEVLDGFFQDARKKRADAVEEVKY